MRHLALMAVTATFLLGGCSQTPVPSTYMISWQDKMQSVYHWEILADELAEDLDSFMEHTPEVRGLPVYVVPHQDAPTFGVAFHRLLESELYKQGIPVTSDPASGIHLQYDVLGVQHGEEGRDAGLPPGLFSLVGGAAALSTTDLSSSTWAAIYGGTGIVADLLAGSVALRTSSEVLFTASVYRKDMLLYRLARRYYVPEGDQSLYAAAPERSPTVVLREPEGTRPLDLLHRAESRCNETGRIALVRKIEQEGGSRTLAFDCVEDVVSISKR